MDTAKVVRDAGYNFSAPFLLASGGTRIIQIQPTLRCNLRCAHCYTESGPDRHEEISLESLKGFLSEAGSLGYQYVGISGGEPLLWRGLEDFLANTKYYRSTIKSWSRICGSVWRGSYGRQTAEFSPV